MTRLPARSHVLLLAGALPLACLAALGTGPIAITPMETLRALAQALGMPAASDASAMHETVLVSIRLPRIVLGLLVGAGTAIAGAALQGLFRNPLADPGLIGVSGGAALGAACAIVLQQALAPVLVPLGGAGVSLFAFAGSFAVTLVVYRLGTHAGRTDVTIMLLAGVAIQALTMAAIGFLQYSADDRALRDLTFWSLGSLGGATWRAVAVAAPLIGIALAALPLLARALNALLLGEAEARHLGYDSERVKLLVVALAALAVGTAVAAAGSIGFVGLIVPHLVRLLTGPDHRFVLPGSALLGAMLAVAADALARTVVSPAELPIGILFALAGAPFFIYLLRRAARHGAL